MAAAFSRSVQRDESVTQNHCSATLTDSSLLLELRQLHTGNTAPDECLQHHRSLQSLRLLLLLLRPQPGQLLLSQQAAHPALHADCTA